MTLTTGILQGGANSHSTTSEEVNAIATDFVIEGVVGTITSTSGVAPMTGAFAVNAQGTPNMTVAVSAGVGYVTATPTSGNSQTLRVKNSASANVTISANSTGGTRYDWVYIKIDPDKAKDPAADASDVATLTTSRSTSASVDNGTPPTYATVLAVVTVTNGASSITNANIADRRVVTGATPGEGTVTLDKIKDNAVTTAKIADDSVTAAKIDWASTGANGGIWWEELGRTTLGTAGDTITISSIPARTYLKIIFALLPTGGTLSSGFTFNSDSSVNYSARASTNGGADGTGASSSSVFITSTAAAEIQFADVEVLNMQTFEKMIQGHAITSGASGASNLTTRRELSYKWSNTSAKINRIDVSNIGTGDYAIGSEVIVLGHN